MNGHNFAAVTPIEVIPALTFSVRQALFDGTIFLMFAHSKNAHFALAPNSAPLRGNRSLANLSAIVSHFFPEYL